MSKPELAARCRDETAEKLRGGEMLAETRRRFLNSLLTSTLDQVPQERTKSCETKLAVEIMFDDNWVRKSENLTKKKRHFAPTSPKIVSYVFCWAHRQLTFRLHKTLD